MSIQSMRNSTQKNRWVVVLVVVLLILGLLISYAVSSSVAGTGLNQDQAPDAEKQIAYYQQTVTALEKDLAANPTDYSTLTQLGENYYNLAVMQGSNKDSAGMDASLAKGIGYYQSALENAPETLNALGKAELNMRIGGMYFYTEQKDKGYDYMTQAVTQVPDNYDMNATYAYYLWMDGKYEEAIAALEAYKAIAPANDEHAADLETTLKDLRTQLADMKSGKPSADAAGTPSDATGGEATPPAGAAQ